jgi:hypothetical protein
VQGKKLSMLIGCMLVTGIGIASIGSITSATASDAPPPPAPPAWVRTDGTVDAGKLPDAFPVVGPDGKLVKDKDGNVLRVTRSELSGKLPPGPAAVTPDRKENLTKVGENSYRKTLTPDELVRPGQSR